jgi:hypothetical protein
MLCGWPDDILDRVVAHLPMWDVRRGMCCVCRQLHSAYFHWYLTATTSPRRRMTAMTVDWERVYSLRIAGSRPPGLADCIRRAPRLELLSLCRDWNGTGTFSDNVMSAILKLGTQLAALRLHRLDAFLVRAADRRQPDAAVALTCRELGFHRVNVEKHHPDAMLVAWDRLFCDPLLERIIVTVNRENREKCFPVLPEATAQPTMIPNRFVVVDYTLDYNRNGRAWFDRLAATASRVEYRFEDFHLGSVLSMLSRESRPAAWRRAVLRLTVPEVDSTQTEYRMLGLGPDVCFYGSGGQPITLSGLLRELAPFVQIWAQPPTELFVFLHCVLPGVHNATLAQAIKT